MGTIYEHVFVYLCTWLTLSYIQQGTCLQCYSCRQFNVTVLADSAGVSIDMSNTLMANNLDFCGDDGDIFKRKLESNNTGIDGSMYKKVCLASTTRCTKTWGTIEYTFPYGDYSARFRIDYYLRGCDTMERLELPTTPAPAVVENPTADAPTESPAPKPDGGEKTGLDALIPDTDSGGSNTISDGVDPYKPKDKCYSDIFYLHSALYHDFYDFEDVQFTNGTVCFCTGSSLCNTGAILSQSTAWVIAVLLAGLAVLKL